MVIGLKMYWTGKTTSANSAGQNENLVSSRPLRYLQVPVWQNEDPASNSFVLLHWHEAFVTVAVVIIIR